MWIYRTENEFYIDEKFGKVPNGWSLVNLKDVCTSPGEYGANASAIDFLPGAVRYIRITDIDDYGNLIEEDKVGIDRTIGNNYLLKNNDFLFARTGDTVGKSLLYKESMGLAAYAGYLIKFTFNTKVIVPEYFALVAKSDFFEAFKTAMKRVGAKPNINSREYGSFKFILPNDTEEQAAITAIPTKVDEAIAATENSINAAEKLKKALMQNLLTGRLKADGNLRKQDEYYVDEKFGKVPVGWLPGKLGDIADIIAGQSPTGDTYNDEGKGTPMLNGPTEFTDYFPIPVQFTTKPTKVCQIGDILFTVRGSSTGRMNFADQEYCIGRGLAAIRAKESSDNDFLYYILVKIAHLILAEAKGAGSTFPNVNRGELLKKKITYPESKEEQQKIGAKIRATENVIHSKQNKIKSLQRLKKSMMQNLLTGKVRLSAEVVDKILQKENRGVTEDAVV
jgi:type I restriction enzyme, S subunit